jgi:hypothetical protein
MSSRPTYSTGCHACRKMKIKVRQSLPKRSLLPLQLIHLLKCDETKPECNRCTRASRLCPGYRDASDVIFRPMNISFKIGHTKALKRKDGHLNARKCNMQNTPPITLSPNPSTDWEQQAEAYFFSNYVLENSHGSGGYLDFLPDLYRSAPLDSCLRESTKAVSMASLANVTSIHHLNANSWKSYSKALRLVIIALDNETDAKSDHVLASLVLFQMLEVSVRATRYKATTNFWQGYQWLIPLPKKSA